MIRDKLISDREKYIAEKERIHIDYKYTLNHELPPVYYMYQGTINYIDYLLDYFKDTIKKYDTGLDNGRWTKESIKEGLSKDMSLEEIVIKMGEEQTLIKEKLFKIIDRLNDFGGEE